MVESKTLYSVRLAATADDLRAAQALRFEVFNLELGQGSPSAFEQRLDADPFDEVCEHLIVEHLPSHTVVGTYRLQTGARAAANLGYYSEQEFEFSMYEPVRLELVELGRACVARAHRNVAVLGLLWKAIADYAVEHKARYLIGCSSLSSREPAVGASAYSALCRKHLVATAWRTRPRPPYECSMHQLAEQEPHLPKLLRAYLSLGARICGPPALDRSFGTIDFLTLLDLDEVPAQVKARYFGQPVR